MPGPRSPRVIALPESRHAELLRLTRSPSVAAGLARRARMVLLAAEGVPLRQIAERLGVQRRVVRPWLDRFRQTGMDGLRDRPRPGRPPVFSP